jgi:nucleoside triphosphate diphosphatase
MSMTRLLEIMAALRDRDGGCPWDLEQTWSSIAPHTIEEAYELADAIEDGDPAKVRAELGDLLFQVVFQSRIAEEGGLFDFEDVAAGIAAKLERRHPHVFGDAKVRSPEEQTVAWEAHKAAERRADGGSDGALDGVTLGLPALTRAAKLGRRAAAVGFDWQRSSEVIEKVEEECAELRDALAAGDVQGTQAELGDLLFSLAQLARKLGTDPEVALRAANSKFERRFRRVEAWLADGGRKPGDVDMVELEALWTRAKREEG